MSQPQGATLAYFNDRGDPSDFLGLKFLAKGDFFGSRK